MSDLKMCSLSVMFVILFILGSECKKKVSSGHKQKLDVCTLEIDEGICGGDSFSEEPENSTIYYGFNNETMKCEEFVYEGCGGNDNRFDSMHECWRLCYTPLKYFLARVTDYLMHQYTEQPGETRTSSPNSERDD